jgi:D-beta-D-heptose 7-phosphate kinase/D-beta-D-heptose 1-phosphate adenosyltransferase
MNPIQQVASIVESGWRGKHIAIVGDVMLDKYVTGRVDRISEEAPVPIVLATRRRHQPGGAANVAMNIVGMGGRATLFGFGGQDEDFHDLSMLLRSAKVDERLTECPGFPTTTKLRILGGRHQMIRLDTEITCERPSAAYRQLIKSVCQLLPEVDALVLSDYAKGVLTEDVSRELIEQASRSRVPVLVDSKSRDFRRYRGATLMCPNIKELAIALHETDADVDLLLKKAHGLIEDLGLKYLMVTLGERGISLVEREYQKTMPAVARQVFDVCGAGDTVVAALALCVACAVAPEIAAQFANVAAGIVVGKIGAAPVARHELIEALTSWPVIRTIEKVLDLPRLLVRVAEWRAAGETIVFTNGCFDVLHAGHVRLLEHCRELGSKVIVGINSDDSIRSLKGPGRPVVEEVARARVLSALTFLDAVTVFDAPTPIELILALKPDVLVKGGDYAKETVVGATEVQSWGGKTVILPLTAGYSTTRLIAKAAGVDQWKSANSHSAIVNG